jgi:hypothetical protein
MFVVNQGTYGGPGNQGRWGYEPRKRGRGYRGNAAAEHAKEGTYVKGGRGRGQPPNWPTRVSCEMNIKEWEAALSKAGILEKYGDIITGFKHGFHQGIPDHSLGELESFIPENHTSAVLAKEKIENNIKKDVWPVYKR